MAKVKSEAAEVWLWAIEYLGSLEDFDRSLLEELIESIPNDVWKSAGEKLQSPFPTTPTLELERLKEKIMGGFMSDEYSKRWCGAVADAMDSDSVLPMECTEAQINEELSKEEIDDQSLGSDSIEDDSSDDDDDVELVETSGANAGVEMQNELQQPTPAVTVHSAETNGANCDARIRLEGKKLALDVGHGDSVHTEEGSSARNDDGVQNGKQSSGAVVENVKSGGTESIEKNQNGFINARSNDDAQSSKQPSGVMVENPLVNYDGNRNEPVKSVGNKPIETSCSGSSTCVKSSDTGAKQLSSDGVDRPLQNGDKNRKQVKSRGKNKLVEDNHDGSLSLRSSNNPLSHGDVQYGKQPPAVVVEHPLVNGDRDHNIPIQNRNVSSTSVKTSDARASHCAQNSKQPSGSTGVERSKKTAKNTEQVKSGGYGRIEKNRNGVISINSSDSAAHSNDADIQNRQQTLGPIGPIVEHHPSTSGAGNHAKQLKSDGKKPIETTHQLCSTFATRADNNLVQNPQQSSRMEPEKEHEKERLTRKRKMNSFLENHQLLPAPGIAAPTDLNLCVKCHQTGAVLVCATAGCPMMLHKSCLGFDVEEGGGLVGSFCCPLCSYSRAVAELREAQRRVALTKKDLTGFVVDMQQL